MFSSLALKISGLAVIKFFVSHFNAVLSLAI